MKPFRRVFMVCTERVVSYLTEELVGLGHEVSLFSSADAVTSAKLIHRSTPLR